MSRSGYDDGDDGDNWSLIRWRGQVASAIRGKRGQAFLRELIEALDALPIKRLIRSELWNGEVCALGAMAARRGLDVITLDAEDYDHLAGLLGVASQLVREIEYENDEMLYANSPETRWHHMREWATKHLIEPK